MTALLLPIPGNEALAERLAGALGIERATAAFHRFPDGETYVRIDSPVSGHDLIIVCTLDRPDGKFLPLTFAAATARDLGARLIGLACPYLGYMRQDTRFRPGEGITSAYFARMLGHEFDWLVTVDPHLHRHSALSAIYGIRAEALHASGPIARWIAAHVTTPLLIGPDEESGQWVSQIAAGVGAPYIVLRKERRGDRDVSVAVPDMERWSAHTPVLVDDIVSSARTMIETVGHLRHAGFTPPVCIGIHAVFAEGAFEALSASGAGRIVTCDTIPHPSNAIPLTELLAEGIRRLTAIPV